MSNPTDSTAWNTATLSEQLDDRLNPTVNRPPRFHPLTQREWDRIEPVVPRAATGRSPNLRRTVDAVLWKMTTGRDWSQLPAVFGPWRTAYKPYRRWLADGTLDAIMKRFNSARTATGT